MKLLALISGGKDSFFNIHHCLSQGHELVALANLRPGGDDTDEINSFMFQTVGHDIVEYYEECVGVPLFRRTIKGSSSNQELEYSVTPDDEIEDLYSLLNEIKMRHPEIEGVSCGAILSNYQRTRVENVCGRLGFTSLAYLWQRDQDELIQEMFNNGLDARIIKVAAIGLEAKHLGESIQTLYPHLAKLNKMYEVHICGEGGEFETMVLDSPVFRNHRLEISDSETITDSDDGVSYLKIRVEMKKKKCVEDVSLEGPSLLEGSFKEIEKAIGSVEEKADASIGNICELITKPYTCVSKNDKLYISDLCSKGSSIREQGLKVFSQLNSILAENQLGLNDIQHITLLLSDISKFSEINEIYSQQFEKFHLPPSRVCIETNLSEGCSLKLSAIVLKNVATKSGIHIRSISYWAPQNIGPYSQSLIETREKYKLATLSGQIPLIPATMALSEHGAAFDSVLSLQHLHRVKKLINVQRLASVMAFVTRKDLSQVISSTWDEYGYVEDISRKSLVILHVKDLPKHAKVEWAGFSYEDITGLYDDDDEDEVPSFINFEKLSKCIDSFEQREAVSIGKGRVTIYTLFTNELATIKDLIAQNSGKNFLQVLATTSSANKLLEEELAQYEILPAIGVYNHEAQEFEFAVYLIVEL